MKAISSVVAVILILLIIMALTALLWLFLSELFPTLTGTGERTINRTVITISSCMWIESIGGNKVYLRNCGKGFITSDTLAIYLDDDTFNFTMTPEIVGEEEAGTISMPIWGIPPGDHKLKITNPQTMIQRIVEVVLPDSCVLALDFDEDSGTNVYDKSGYGNDGTLQNSDDDEWVSGRFGSALQLDGDNDYVGIPISQSLNISDELTMEAWINLPPIMIGDDWARGIVERRQRYRLLLLENSTPYGLRFDIQDTDGDWCTIQKGCPGTDRILNANQWYHTMAVFNGSYMMIYVNGELNVTEERLNSKIDVSDSFPVEIGANDIFYFLNGTIDSVRIHNKGLTPDETLILKMR